MKDNQSQDFFEQQTSLMQKGKKIVTSIVIFNLVGIVFSAIVDFNIISIIYNLVLNVLLYSGFNIIRYFYAIGSALATVAIVVLFPTLLTTLGVFITILYCIYGVLCLVMAIILFKNEAVIEFLYKQKNG